MKKSYLKLTVLLFIAVFLLSSCKLIQNILNTEVSPEQKRVIYAKADKMKFRGVKRIRKSGSNKQPLRAGQWVTYLMEMKTGDKDVSLVTVKVIKASRGVVILETATWSAANNAVRSISQVTYRNYPTRQKLTFTQATYNKFFDNVKIERIRTKNGDDPARDVPQHIINMGMMGAKSFSRVRSGGLNAGSCSTEYIRTGRCYMYNYTVSALGITDTGTVYAHSSVPILGYIKTESNLSTTKVISFGYRGAKSDI